MRVLVRADASARIGSGHVVRCLTLAGALATRGAQVSFVCRDRPGELSSAIRDRGFPVRLLPPAGDDSSTWLGTTEEMDAEETARGIATEDWPDWVIVDHYGIGVAWEEVFRNRGSRVAVLDDLADRHHSCDLLLDQTYGRRAEDYHPWVHSGASLLTGSRYALLREEFAALREERASRAGPGAGGIRILVNFGGADPVDATGAVARLLQAWQRSPDTSVPVATFVVGPAYQRVDALDTEVRKIPFECEILRNVQNMAQLMAESDLAIGAGGTTSWERCCLGLPTLLVSIADNQAVIADNLHDAGAVAHLGRLDEVLEDPERFFRALGHLTSDSDVRDAMGRAAMTVADGLGAERAVDEIIRLSEVVRT